MSSVVSAEWILVCLPTNCRQWKSPPLSSNSIAYDSNTYPYSAAALGLHTQEWRSCRIFCLSSISLRWIMTFRAVGDAKFTGDFVKGGLDVMWTKEWTFEFSVMLELMHISFIQSSSSLLSHAASSMAVGGFVVSPNTSRGIPPRIVKRSNHSLYASGNNGAIVSNSSLVHVGM